MISSNGTLVVLTRETHGSAGGTVRDICFTLQILNTEVFHEGKEESMTDDPIIQTQDSEDDGEVDDLIGDQSEDGKRII
jgi:hypothetical protein